MQLIDHVYEDLKERIFQAQFKPNQLITERAVCDDYEVSRVTAGEALHRLCHEGHLVAYPRTGYMVRALTPQEMAQIKRLRVCLEALVVDIACAEASDEALRGLYAHIIDDPLAVDNISAANRRFHVEMARLTEDPYIINAVENLLGAASRVEQYVAPTHLASWQDFHRDIVDALCVRNAARARERLLEDINQR